MKATGPGVKVGRGDGYWYDASDGMPIGVDDFVKVPKGSQAVVSTTNGGTQTINGTAMIPGRWLYNPPSEGGAALIWFSQEVAKAATYLVGTSGGTTHTNSAGKA